MKYFFILLFCLYSLSSIAQSKLEIGIMAEGTFVLKKELSMPYNGHIGEKYNWGSALGVYAKMPVWKPFSVSLGIMGRYAGLQKGDPVWTKHEKYDWDYLSGYDYLKYPRYYWVIPFNLEVTVLKNYFISGGMEYCQLTNDYTIISDENEYNWTVGIGNQKHRLKWKLQYVEGLDYQEIINTEIDNKLWYRYKTKRISLTFSYPLWIHNKK